MARASRGARAAVLVLGATLCLVLTGVAQLPAAPPSGVHIGVGEDPKTTMTVAWVGGPSPTGARVEYGPTDAYGETVEAATPTPLPGEPLLAYRAALTGLRPATTYHYRVVLDGGASEDLSFTTAPDGPATFSVAAWGDQGVPDAMNPLGESDGDSPRQATELVASLNVSLHLHAGDLSYSNGVPSTWTAYFDMLEPYAAGVPYMTAVGNHEREAGQRFFQYDTRLSMPSAPGERWYAFRWGDAVFVSLDTEHACAGGTAQEGVPGLVADRCDAGPQEQQLAFLSSTLEAARADPSVTWIVVFHHYPLWSDGPHGSNEVLQQMWGALYDEHHVDVVVQAHDHMYERSKPIVGAVPAEAGTTYVTVGTGGASHYAFQHDTPPQWEAARDDEHYGALVMTFSGGRLDGRFVTTDGQQADTWALEKDPGGAARLVPSAGTPPVDPAEGGDDADDGGGGIPSPAMAVMLMVLAVLASVRRRRRD